MAKERREEKVNRESEWRELYGEERVESGGRSNLEGWDEDDFM